MQRILRSRIPLKGLVTTEKFLAGKEWEKWLQCRRRRDFPAMFAGTGRPTNAGSEADVLCLPFGNPS